MALKNLPNVEGEQAFSTSTPEAPNKAAIVKLDRTREHYQVVDQIAWSYSTSPTGGRITVDDDKRRLLDLKITASGMDSIEFPQPLAGAYESGLVVTLHGGGEGVVGNLFVNHR